MGFFSALQQAFTRWHRRGRVGGPSAKPARVRPGVEPLEERALLTTWFVSTGGSDFNNGLSPFAPLRSIQAAVNQASNFDTIKVAGGTYSYFDDPFQNNAAAAFAAGVRPAALIVWNKILTIQGGFSAFDFNTYNPTANVTALSGSGILRGVFVGGNAQFVGLTLQGFTIQSGLALPESEFGGLNTAYAFGGGMWINTPFAFSFGFALQDVNFVNDYSVGGPDFFGILGGAGGAGTGGGLAVSYAQGVQLSNVKFQSNLAKAADGSVRGGVAQGGALFLDHAGVVGNVLSFTNNAAVGGTSAGGGVTADGERSGALGGGASVEAGSFASLSNVNASGNLALAAAHPNGTGGNALGGAFYVEASAAGAAALSLSASTLQGNVAEAGNGGLQGGQGGGGGLFSQFGSINLNLDTIINNVAISGGGPAAGPVSGGGLNLNGTSFLQASVSIANTTVRHNVIAFGTSNNQNNGGGGAGLWLSGITATLGNDTFDNNVFGGSPVQGSLIGQAILLINAAGAPATVASISGGTIENHTNNIGAAALHARGGTIVNLHAVKFTNNTKNDNADGTPFDPTGNGTFNFS